MNKIARISQIAIALILLVAAGLKSTDIVGFSREIDVIVYGLVPGKMNPPSSLSLWSAILVIAVEFVLAGLIITGSGLRIVTISTLVLIGGFTSLSIIAVLSGKLDSCGCFGALIERSPGISLIENLILLILAIISVQVNIRQRSLSVKPFIFIISISIIYSIFFYFFPPRWAVLRTGMEWSKPEAYPQLPSSEKFDIWVLDPNCSDCQTKVDLLNELSLLSPCLIGLTDATPGRIGEFEIDFEPLFPIHQTDSGTIDNFGLPYGSLISVNNGTVSGIWRINDLRPDNPESGKTTGQNL